jgi:hypothetical protein
MLLSRIPQRVASALAPVSSCFRRCPQAQHSRLLCWLLVALILAQGSATLKQLTRTLPRRLHYWTVLRTMRAGYWSAAELIEMLAGAVLALLPPPPPDGTLYLIADTTLIGRTGKKQPLAHYTRLNEFERFTFAHTLLLIVAHGAGAGSAFRSGPWSSTRSAKANRTSNCASFCMPFSRPLGAGA